MSYIADAFAPVMGSRRGLGLHLDTIIAARPAVASEEFHRLRKLAEEESFAEPLAVMRATSQHLDPAVPRFSDLAEALNEHIAASLVQSTSTSLPALAFALGWTPGFHKGILSNWCFRMRKVVMAQPTSLCPPDEWREWMGSLWDEHFLGVLTSSFEEGYDEIASHILNISEESRKSFLSRLPPDGWAHVARVALTTPRPHSATVPLTKAEQKTCHEAAYAALYHDGLGGSLNSGEE